jgi:hypothetical protein
MTEQAMIRGRRQRERAAVQAVCGVVMVDGDWITPGVIPTQMTPPRGRKSNDARKEQRDRTNGSALQ